MFIEGIIQRLNNPELKKSDNDGRIVLDGTIGEYLENYNNHFLDLFLKHATGKYLDLHGLEYNIIRKEDESDISYRNRIITEKSIIQNIDNFLNLDTSLWVYFRGVTDGDTLTSRNPYLKNKHDDDYVLICFSENKDYLTDKFILEDILWV
ncbi:hypothetical protein [uncultured Methanobrevibacter sp.]|uniref:hypothetical protein n=1 Tax=uncultured Methanobrevibacter sp. TaxID=253161 RepID=UPI0025CD8E88|nr:hypothetical protein [uncultured Methanobrevibacter sp.]